MGYLGRNPSIGTQKMLDSIESQFNGALTTFDLRYNGTPTYPTISASLIVSLGGVLQEPGEAYYVSSDKIVFSEAPNAGTECWILLYSQYGAAAGGGSSGGAVSVATGEPMGHEDKTHSSISFDNASRTFTIEPNTGGGYSDFVVWTKGTKRTYSSAQTVQIGTATGLYYIYFDPFGVLQYRTTYFVWDEDTPTAYVYWNATTSTGVFVADERHGITLDWATHEYLHRTRGAVIAEGFGISNYVTTGDGSVDAHAQFDLANGTFFDEDLEIAITHSATPTVGTFTQVLQGNAEIPVYYMSGSGGDWVKDSATEFACKQSATTLQYNSLSGGTWSTTAADNNRYVISWVVATNEINAPIIAILGQNQYSSIGEAEEEVFGDLTLTNFPIVEFRPLWKVVFRTSTGFTNTPNALIANVLDLRQLSETGEAGTVVSDHGLLSGLADDDHSQYLNTTIDRAGVTANISTTGNLGGANLTLTGELRGPANFVIDPAVVGDDTGTVEIKGNLTVQGTTTTINSTTVDLDHISLGDNEIANFGDGNDLKIYHNATDNYFDTTTVGKKVFFRTSNSTSLDTNAFSILANGNVGIGTDNPGVILDVREKKTAGSTQIRLYNTDNSNTTTQTAEVGLSPDSRALAGAGIKVFKENADFSTNASRDVSLALNAVQNNSQTEAVRITSAGNVGIGTDAPDTRLHIEDSWTAAATTNDIFTVARAGDAVKFVVGYDSAETDMYLGTNTNHTLQIRTNDSARVTITNVGNVGIGSTNPVRKLQVGSFAGTPEIIIAAGTTGAPALLFGDGPTGVDTYRGFVRYDHSVNSLDFATNATSRLIIDSSGNTKPTVDAAYDLGSPTFRWANIYSADLQLSNEGSGNEVDGTWGAYTIQEGEEELYLINRRSGKKFKFVLEEVKD